jgi:hypothetical protein
MARTLRLAVLGLALACFGTMGCQPLYGAKPEKLRNPEKKRKPPEAEVKAADVKYVEECQADFREDPKKMRLVPQPTVARQLIQVGDDAMAGADKAKDDNAKVGLWKEAISKYINALIKDPYNVEATLDLARAYDRFLRKGCAIAMLKRLATISTYPRLSTDANHAIDSIGDNAGWFKGYRKDAIAAVGR